MDAPFAAGKSMKDKTIAILENRIGEQMADLVRKYGGTPFCAPALAEIPDIDPTHIGELIERWTTAPPHYFIFQTGVGVKALFAATDGLGLSEQLLDWLKKARIVARGPKPTAALRSRNVRIDAGAKDPFTTTEVLAEIDLSTLSGKRIVVQRYGETNWELQKTLEESGAEVIEITTYRWGLPADIEPLIRLMDALERHEIDAVAFTSASQATNLFTVAKQTGREAALKDNLNQAVVASIGPVCSATLSKLGVKVDIEAHPPKLGPFINAINTALLAA
jgi:uroporphyrinogen-III synthase